MIDLEARRNLRLAVDDFLSDRTTAYAFDEAIHEISCGTRDETVRIAAHYLWLCYSDVEDHPVRLDRETWNYVQRLLLVIDSGAELRRVRTRLWHASQVEAAVTLAAMLAQLWSIVPLAVAGIKSILLGRQRKQFREMCQPPDPLRAWPFPSLGAIERALVRAPEFRKQRYRPEIATRRRRRWQDIEVPAPIGSLLLNVAWILVAPLVLAWQCLPIGIVDVRYLEPDLPA